MLKERRSIADDLLTGSDGEFSPIQRFYLVLQTSPDQFALPAEVIQGVICCITPFALIKTEETNGKRGYLHVATDSNMG